MTDGGVSRFKLKKFIVSKEKDGSGFFIKTKNDNKGITNKKLDINMQIEMNIISPVYATFSELIAGYKDDYGLERNFVDVEKEEEETRVDNNNSHFLNTIDIVSYSIFIM